MPGTVITFPVRGAGVVILLLAQNFFTLFWPKKLRSLGHYQWEAWAWLGRAGRLLGADILAAGEPALPLHALILLRSSPFDRL